MTPLKLEAPRSLTRRFVSVWMADAERRLFDRAGQVEIDFTHTREIDASGIAALLELRHFETLSSDRIRLANVSPAILQTFEIMGLHRDFLFVKRAAEAANGLPPILIVEDEHIIRSVTSMVLTPLGHPIVTAADGHEALAITRSAQPGLIILDYILPGLDGSEVLRQLKASESTRHIPVIIVSANSDVLDHRNDAFRSADGIFAKPFSSAAFRDEAARLLAGRPLRQPQLACA